MGGVGCRANKRMDKNNYNYLKDVLKLFLREHGVRNMEWPLTYLFPVWAAPNRFPQVDPKTDSPVVKNKKEIHKIGI